MVLPTYETLVIYRPDCPSEKVSDIQSKIKDVVSRHKGEVLEETVLGSRRLTYEINGHQSGTYVKLLFHSVSGAVIDIDRALRQNEMVLRHMVTRQELPLGKRTVPSSGEVSAPEESEENAAQSADDGQQSAGKEDGQ